MAANMMIRERLIVLRGIGVSLILGSVGETQPDATTGQRRNSCNVDSKKYEIIELSRKDGVIILKP